MKPLETWDSGSHVSYEQALARDRKDRDWAREAWALLKGEYPWRVQDPGQLVELAKLVIECIGHRPMFRKGRYGSSKRELAHIWAWDAAQEVLQKKEAP